MVIFFQFLLLTLEAGENDFCPSFVVFHRSKIVIFRRANKKASCCVFLEQEHLFEVNPESIY